MPAKAPPSDVFFASIGELSAGLRAKEYSAVELTRAFCDRLEKIGPAHNALALTLRKSALKKARRCRRRSSASARAARFKAFRMERRITWP